MKNVTKMIIVITLLAAVGCESKSGKKMREDLALEAMTEADSVQQLLDEADELLAIYKKLQISSNHAPGEITTEVIDFGVPVIKTRFPFGNDTLNLWFSIDAEYNAFIVPKPSFELVSKVHDTFGECFIENNTFVLTSLSDDGINVNDQILVAKRLKGIATECFKLWEIQPTLFEVVM